ncbi:MAG TPA: CDP-diacylglycerol--serine O-phosphatidyltransferase [bacterium]|nr:CDP-diacylglycerol--serine O-phosphatidyltransferase [bacterium]
MSALKIKTTPSKAAANSRLRKSIYLLPNLLTAANMVFGILSITYSIQDSLTLMASDNGAMLPFVLPAKLILVSIFLDFMDGRVARATGTTSKFGMEFDSLSDLISFGMAPAILIYLSVLRYLGAWGIAITVFYVVCAAIRLARFNVQSQVEEKDHFTGLPSPAAAGLLASYVLLSRWAGWYGKGVILNKVMGWYEENITLWLQTIVPIMTVVIALVMISTIAYPSLKKWKRETIKPVTLGIVAIMIFCLVYAYEFAAFALLAFYLVWGIARMFTRKGAERLRPKQAS